MEILDLYDRHMIKTDKTVIRGDKVPEGMFYSVVHIWPINKNGQILIQKRSDSVRWNPNIWACTSGAVSSGENFYEACHRELKEELGINADGKMLSMTGVFKRPTNYCSVWTYKTDVSISELVLQKEEVADAMWVTVPELCRMISMKSFYSYHYIEYLFWYLTNIL